MNYERFKEAWDALERQDKINIFNEYAQEHDPDDQLFVFDDDFFKEFFSDNPAEAVRACFFGNIQSWGDDWLRFNGYGNLVSMSDYEAEEWADDHIEEIYEHPEIWGEYITDEEEEEEDEE